MLGKHDVACCVALRSALKLVQLSALAYLVGVSPVLVFGPVGGVTEGLCAAGELTGVRLLSCVRPQMCFQILQAGVCLQAILKLKWTNVKTHLM